MSKDLETVKLASGKEIAIDPMLLIESIGDITVMTESHTNLLVAVKNVIQRATAYGLEPPEAAELAVELQRRAGKRANSLVHMENEEEKSNDGETEKTTEEPGNEESQTEADTET